MSNLSQRLLEERKRLGFNQTDFGALGGVSKWTQLNYEKGANNPDLDYLVKVGAVGADILYILTGSHGASTTLLADEETLLRSYRAIESEPQKAALLALMATMSNVSEHG